MDKLYQVAALSSELPLKYMDSLMMWKGEKTSSTTQVSTHAKRHKNFEDSIELQDKIENYSIKNYKSGITTQITKKK